MKSTLRNVFHSPRFLVGFIIFSIILLTVLIYPYFVPRDPLQSLGKGFLSPGTYVSVYDANNTDTYRVELPEADAKRLEASLPAADRVTMIEFLTAKAEAKGDVDLTGIDVSDENLDALLEIVVDGRGIGLYLLLELLEVVFGADLHEQEDQSGDNEKAP